MPEVAVLVAAGTPAKRAVCVVGPAGGKSRAPEGDARLPASAQ